MSKEICICYSSIISESYSSDYEVLTYRVFKSFFICIFLSLKIYLIVYLTRVHLVNDTIFPRNMRINKKEFTVLVPSKKTSCASASFLSSPNPSSKKEI